MGCTLAQPGEYDWTVRPYVTLLWLLDIIVSVEQISIAIRCLYRDLYTFGDWVWGIKIRSKQSRFVIWIQNFAIRFEKIAKSWKIAVLLIGDQMSTTGCSARSVARLAASSVGHFPLGHSPMSVFSCPRTYPHGVRHLFLHIITPECHEYQLTLTN